MSPSEGPRPGTKERGGAGETMTSNGGAGKYLEKLEEAIDLDWERRKLADWKRALEFETMPSGRFEAYGRSADVEPVEPGEWPKVSVNEAVRDHEKMLLQQLGAVYSQTCARSYAVPNIRSNYGTGILCSLFGADVFWMDDELNTLPTNKPLEGGRGGDDPIGRLLDAGVPGLDTGFGGRAFETAEYYKETLAPYPKIREAVWIYHPDLQGPIDIVELLWGSAMFLAFYSEPEKVKIFTQLVTETYIKYLTRWFEIVPERDEVYFAHWGNFFKGHVMLRDDSIVNLSPQMYAEFVKPYDERVLGEFGGGGIHFCGKADHCIDTMTDSEHLTAVNMSQPHLNDMRRIHEATVGRGVVLNCHYDEESMAGLDLSKGVTLR